MIINLMVFAAPVFLILIGIEYLICHYKKSSTYQLNDTVNNISSGILEEIGALPLRGLLIYCYYYLYEHHAFFQLNSHSVFTWICLWLCVDFCYYWFHRVSHRNNFFWLGHSVHHQSELYNLSVALRQGYFQAITSWVFYLPLALVGFPTWMFVIVIALNTIYQFWLHTEFIHKMGWFELLFNTPSHHRVHHGKNPQYIDKNYAGSLILWDKLFGTFEPEREPADYGVTEPLHTWNPFTANIKVIQDLLYYGHFLKNKGIVLKALFMPPEWIINRLKQEGITPTKRIIQSKNTKSPALYMLLNIGLTIGMYTYLSLTFNPDLLVSWLVGAFILLTLAGLGQLANAPLRFSIIDLLRACLVLAILTLLFNKPVLALGAGLSFFFLNYFLLHFNSMNAFTPEQLEDLS